jgi:hypothetical protein
MNFNFILLPFSTSNNSSIYLPSQIRAKINNMLTLLLLYLTSGVLLITLSIPLLRGKIKPNGLYGFRVKTTLENPELWYAVNRYTARWLLASGFTLIIAALVLFFVPGLTVDQYALLVLGAWLVVFIPGIILAIRYMNRLSNQDQV